jgi:pimeloyl-ACP methyl ester carboxylesterase
VLVSGSGQQDRNEGIFNHKPFLVLADALTRAGVAVLRFDDRGVGGSGGRETLATATMDDFARDAAAAVHALADRTGVDRNRIGVIGHSEGAAIAIELLADDPLVSFAVMVAGAGMPGHELMIRQWDALLRASGANDMVNAAVTGVWRRVYDRILQGGATDAIARDITPILRELGSSPDQVALQVQTVTSPWWRRFLEYDPQPTLRRIDAPVLAIGGSLDTQVPSAPNLDAIRIALRRAPTDEYEVQELAGLNHLMQTAETGLPQEYGGIEETFAPVALEVIVEWVVRTTRR